jgi:Tfp pilus assembly protein PilF
MTGCAMLGIHVVEDSLTAADHNDLGFSYETRGNLELAEKEYKKAIQKDKDWHLPYFNLGNVYYQKGQLDKAALHYRRSLERKPDHADSMNNLALVRMRQKRYDQARRWIDQAIAIEAKPEYLDTRHKILQQGAGESKK